MNGVSHHHDARDQQIPAGFEQGCAQVRDSRLSYLLGGHGPLIVLLHGWPQTSTAWLAVLEPLARRGFTVLAPDLRGLGGSEHAAGGYGKDDQSDDIRALVERLQLGPRAVVVGHDIGGMVAFSWARRHPQEVDRLILVDLAVPGLGLEQAMDVANGGMWHFGLFMQPNVPEMLISGHEPAFFSWWFRDQAGYPDSMPQGLIDAYTRAYTGREALRAGFEHYRTLLDDGTVNRSWADEGGTLPMPVLAVGGERSAGRHLADALHDVAPQIQALTVSGAGHFVVEQQPQQFLQALEQFLHTKTPTKPQQVPRREQKGTQ